VTVKLIDPGSLKHVCPKRYLFWAKDMRKIMRWIALAMRRLSARSRAGQRR
jgi:hypothetical protein